MPRAFSPLAGVRHVYVRDLPLVPGLQDVEVAVATTELLHIRLAVDAEADDVLVLDAVARGKPLGAAHVALALLIQ